MYKSVYVARGSPFCNLFFLSVLFLDLVGVFRTFVSECGFLSACACVFVSVCSSQKLVPKHIYNTLSLLATHIKCRGSKDSRFTEENKSVL